MMTKTTATTEQPIDAPSEMPVPMGSGIAIAASVLTLVVREWFQRKNNRDSHTTELLSKLIEGLQHNQEKLLEQQHEVIDELKTAVNNLSNSVAAALEAYDHHLIRLDVRLRVLERKDEEKK